jgi:hypothetical protein
VPKVVDSRNAATSEQLLAVALELAAHLIRNKQYPRDFVVNYISSLFGTWLLGHLIAFVPGAGKFIGFDAKVRNILTRFPSLDDDAQLLVLKETWPMLKKLTSLLPGPEVGSLQLTCQSPEVLDQFMTLFKDVLPAGHSFLQQYPNGCQLAGHSRLVKQCLTAMPFHDFNIGSTEALQFLSDPKLIEHLTLAYKLGKEKSLSRANKTILLETYSLLCQRVAKIKLFGVMHSSMSLSIGVKKITSIIGQMFVLLLQGNMAERIFGDVTLQLNKSVHKKMILTQVEELYNLSLPDLDRYADMLQKLEDDSIPWARYIDTALALVFPMFVMLWLYSPVLDVDGWSNWLATLMMPILFRLLSSTIRVLHSTLGKIRPTSFYLGQVDSWLEQALLLTEQNPLLKAKLQLTQINMTNDWDLIQYEITPIVRDRHEQESLSLMLFILQLFDQHHIDYTVVGRSDSQAKVSKVASVFVLASDLYTAFGSMLGSQGQNVLQFATQLQRYYQKLPYLKKAKTVLVNAKTTGYLGGFWENDLADNNLQFDLEFTEQIKLTSEILTLYNVYQHGTKYTLTIPASDEGVTTLENYLKPFIPAKLETDQSWPEIDDPRASSTSSKRSKGKKTRIAGADSTPPSRPATRVSSIRLSSWQAERLQVNSANRNVYMIDGTQHYRNPIYVTCTIQKERFSSPYTAERIYETVSIARYARPKDQAGLFAIDGALEVKILGSKGQGNVRCRAERFVECNTTGCRLYVVDTIIEDGHGIRTSRKKK